MGGGGRGWGVGFCIVYAGCGYQEVEGIRGGVWKDVGIMGAVFSELTWWLHIKSSLSYNPYIHFNAGNSAYVSWYGKYFRDNVGYCVWKDVGIMRAGWV